MSSIEEDMKRHDYWIEKYNLVAVNSNLNDQNETPGPTRSFKVGLIDSILDLESASSAILEMADHFAEQMWHDLAEQNHVNLRYWHNQGGEYGEDKFFPEFGSFENQLLEIPELDFDVLDRISPGRWATWFSDYEVLDIKYARDRVEDFEGKEHFVESNYVEHTAEESFSSMNLGMAIGAGKEYGDIDLVSEEIYNFYLDEIFRDDEDMFETRVEITSDTPWLGIRYSELTENQQMNLAINLLTSMEHPYLGKLDGISRHFLCCLAFHDATADNVKALLLLQLSN